MAGWCEYHRTAWVVRDGPWDSLWSVRDSQGQSLVPVNIRDQHHMIVVGSKRCLAISLVYLE